MTTAEPGGAGRFGGADRFGGTSRFGGASGSGGPGSSGDVAGRRILVFGGWFGSRNAGDEAILVALRDALARAEPGASICAHTIDPEFTRSVTGVEPVFAPQDTHFVGKALALLRAYRAADVFLVSGGTPIFDYYYASRAFHLGIPLLLGKPMVWVGIGTKPVTSRFGRWFYRTILQRARYISVRDPDVGERLRAMGVTRQIALTADSAISTEPASDRVDDLLREAGLDPMAPTTALCPIYLSDDHRSHYHEPVGDDTRERSYAALASLADRLVDAGRQVVFLPMHRVAPDDDREVIRSIQARMRHMVPLLEPSEDPREVMGVLARMALVVAMRLHALVLASACEVPVTGIAFDVKVRTYMDYLGMADYCEDIDDLDAERLFQRAESCWAERSDLRKRLGVRMGAWRALVDESVTHALEQTR